MKKYVWLLIAAAFAVAVLAMVGCKPAETPAESPSPTAPTPTADTACPKVVSTVVQDLYDYFAGDWGTATPGGFKIIITFDEPIAGSYPEGCIENPAAWTVKVKNASRVTTELTANVTEASLSTDKKKITIEANVSEVKKGQTFYGLLCNDARVPEYKNLLGKTPVVADTVTWKLNSFCAIYDALGNVCCGGEGEACCSVVCEVTIPTGCPL